MTGRLEGKVAFITGAARGQGRSHALRLAEEGADIIAVDVCAPVPTVDGYPASTPEDLEKTVALVEERDRRIVARHADVRDFARLQATLDEGVSELGRLDIVVANAGILTMGMAHEQSDEQWGTMLDVNLTGVWHTAKAAIPTLIAQGTGGSIIMTSSLAGLKGNAGCSSYVAAKFGVTGLGQSLAKELAEHRVRVNTLHPTNVRTDMLDNPMVRAAFRPDLEAPTFEDAVGGYAEMNVWPLPWVEPADISAAVAWLASDDARYVTGTAQSVDLGAAIR